MSKDPIKKPPNVSEMMVICTEAGDSSVGFGGAEEVGEEWIGEDAYDHGRGYRYGGNIS